MYAQCGQLYNFQGTSLFFKNLNAIKMDCDFISVFVIVFISVGNKLSKLLSASCFAQFSNNRVIIICSVNVSLVQARSKRHSITTRMAILHGHIS